MRPRGGRQRGRPAAAQRSGHVGQRARLELHLLAQAVEADDERHGAEAQRRAGGGVEDLDRVRYQVLGEHGARGGPGILEPIERHADEPLVFRQRPQLERRLHHDAERAVGADEQLGQIVARHVLHDLAAPAHDAAVGRDDGDADEEIAHGAVQMTSRAGRVGGDEPADGGALGLGRIEREPLPACAQRRLQRLQRQTGLRRHREIAGLVLDEAIEPLEREHDPDARGRRPDRRRGAAAPRGHRHLGRGGLLHDGADLADGARQHDDVGRAPFHDERREVDAREDVRRADGGAKLVEQALHARSAAHAQKRWASPRSSMGCGR